MSSRSSRERIFTTIATGEIAGATSATVLPTISCLRVKFRAHANNTGKVYIGIAGVTIQNGTTDTTTGYELSAGESTEWIPTDNLNHFYKICDNATDDFTYMALVS